MTATFDLDACRNERAGWVLRVRWICPGGCRAAFLVRLFGCKEVEGSPASINLPPPLLCLLRRWGMFRDRRPELYGAITTLDGSSNRRA